MTWDLTEIKRAYDEGKRQGASHMIVAWDRFGGHNYPIYVEPGVDPKTKMPTNGDRVDECYDYRLGWDSQSVEWRAIHWEPAPANPEKTT